MKTKFVAAILIAVVVVIVAYVTGIIGALLNPTETALFTVDFNANPATSQNRTIQFNATVQGGIAPYDYIWNFGDNTSAIGIKAPTHTYASPANYTVKLIVIDSAGISREVTKVITVS